MRYNIAILIVLFSAGSVMLSSCQKELTCYGAECPGIPIYSFVQINGTCSNALVNGTYKQETDLTDSNTVAIKVSVTKIGAYNINTDTVNGFYFKGEGEFSNAGVVTVLLKGIGKPVAAGNYIFTSSKTSGCSYAVMVDSIPYVEKLFYDVTIDGIRYQQTVGGGIKNMNFFNPNSQIAIPSRIGTGQLVLHNDGSVSDEGLGIQKGFINTSNVTLAGLANFFALGSHLFSPPNSADGITIGWVNGTEPAFSWGAYQSPGTQNGSSFTITNIETYADTQGRPIAKVKASFNCILYNERGESKVLTNGKFYAEFANIER